MTTDVATLSRVRITLVPSRRRLFEVEQNACHADNTLAGTREWRRRHSGPGKDFEPKG
jgi:hypothetical protein